MKKMFKVAIVVLFLLFPVTTSPLFSAFTSLSYAITADEFLQKLSKLVQAQDIEGAKKLILENRDAAKQIFERAMSVAKSTKDQVEREGALFYAQFIASVFKENGDETLWKELEKSDLAEGAKIKEVLLEGFNLFKQGKYKEAKEKFEEAKNLALSSGEKKLEAMSYLGLGEVYRVSGDYENALKYYYEALKIGEQIKDEDTLSTANNNIGLIYKEQGKYEEALAYLNKGLQIGLKLYGGEDPVLGPNYSNIGLVYYKLGRYEDALSYLDKALKILVKGYGEEHPQVAICYNNIGIVYHAQENHEKAAFNYKKALDIRLKVLGEGHPDLTVSYNNIGEVFRELGNYEEALKYYTKALDTLRKMYGEENVQVATCYNNIGLTQHNQGRYKEALISYDKSLKTRLKTLGEVHPDVATSYNNIGLAYYKQKEFHVAKENFLKAIEIVEKLRGKIGIDAKTKSAFLATQLSIYKILISTLYYLQDYSSAFHYLEASKARSLLDEVSKNAIFQSKEIDEKLIQPLNELKEKIVAYENLIANKKTQGQDADEEERQVFQITQDYKNKLNKIYTQYPKYKELTEAEIIKIKEIQKFLDEKTALIEYSLSELDSFTFVITNKDIYMVLPPKGFNVQTMVDVFRETIKFPINKKETYYVKGDTLFTERGVKIVAKEKPGGEKEFKSINYKSAQKEANDKLYAFLVAPVLPYVVDKDNLVIVPDGELAFLPFEALRDKEGKYLIETKNISYVQSASLLAKVAEKEKSQGLPLLAFGGAVYEKDGKKSVKKEEFYLTESEKEYYENKVDTVLAQRGTLTSLYDEKGYQWVDLPGTQEEVKQIGNLFYTSEKDLTNNIITGGKVSEERIKEMSSQGILKKYNILHFATHGLVDLDVPELSAIVLSQQKALGSSATNEDGYLTMGEIMTLNLNSELVNLSACETGLGKLVGGEGVTGLTQSFIMAGAKGVSVSLWSVADVSTYDFMVSFYKKVKEGKSYKGAMVETKREFIKSKWAEPYFWAPFVLYGL